MEGSDEVVCAKAEFSRTPLAVAAVAVHRSIEGVTAVQVVPAVPPT